MKHMRHFFSLFFLSLLISVASQAAVCDGIKGVSKNVGNKDANVSDVIISAGQTKEYVTSSNITLSQAEPVTVDQNGSITLVAGKSIQLLPGTKISAGGFMYASIVTKGKSGKHVKKEIRLVTLEENEKIEEQTSLSQAAALFSPFPSNRKGQLHAAAKENGSFGIYINKDLGIAQEQTHKLAAISADRFRSGFQPTIHNFINLPGYCNAYIDCRYTLRL